MYVCIVLVHSGKTGADTDSSYLKCRIDVPTFNVGTLYNNIL